jgi:cyclopropane fatty-acyl-phospholipid synthase-like methyltransferase
MTARGIVVALAAALCLPLAAQAQQKPSAQTAWDKLYAQREGKDHKFNKFLAEVVKDRAPGKALDIGMGQGRNSLFLAALGWDVTGFDISEIGVKQAQAEAQKRNLKINATVGDVDKFDYGKERYDLIVGMYMHEYLNRNAAKVAAALKPGGLLVVEGIHSDIRKANLEGVKNYGYKNNELPAIFKGLRLRHYEDLMTQSDWDRSGGKPVPVVRLLAQKEQAEAKKK